MSKPVRIFVIDDSEVARELVALILGEAGFDVATSVTPFHLHAALNAFKPALILLDLCMPGLTNDDLPRVVAEYRAACEAKVVLHSAHDGETVTRSVRSAQADGSLEKNDDDQEFVAKIRLLLA